MENKTLEIMNNTTDDNCMNNKDFLILSLLKYICSMHDVPLYTYNCIKEYLIKNGIIDDTTIDTQDMLKLQALYMNVISSIEKKSSNKKLGNIEYSDSRYGKDFIQERVIGQGGYGYVFSARYKIDNKCYAIKKILIKNLRKEDSNYYLNEARLLSQLDHVNIVRYYTSWIELDYPTINMTRTNELVLHNDIKPVLYIQMELYNKSLMCYLKDRNFEMEYIDIDYEYNIFRQIINGLQYIHNNDIIHGDLTPQNIFLDSNNIVKIGDFGLAKKTERFDENQDFGSYGNVLYMSPEQIELKICNKKSDIYSLGIIFLELVNKFTTSMGRMNYIRSFKKEIYSDSLPQHVKELTINMIMEDYTKRYNIYDVKTFFEKHMISSKALTF